MNTPLPKRNPNFKSSLFELILGYFWWMEEENGVKRKKRRGSTSGCKKKKWRSVTVHLSQVKIHNCVFVRVFLPRPGWKISSPTNLSLPTFSIQTSDGEGFSLPPLFSSGFLLKRNKPSILVSTLLEILCS